jgi:hypothetical protein
MPSLPNDASSNGAGSAQTPYCANPAFTRKRRLKYVLMTCQGRELLEQHKNRLRGLQNPDLADDWRLTEAKNAICLHEQFCKICNPS